MSSYECSFSDRDVLPCPFCGGKAVVECWIEYDRSYPEPLSYECMIVGCPGCGVHMSSLEQWNHRIPGSIVNEQV